MAVPTDADTIHTASAFGAGRFVAADTGSEGKPARRESAVCRVLERADIFDRSRVLESPQILRCSDACRETAVGTSSRKPGSACGYRGTERGG